MSISSELKLLEGALSNLQSEFSHSIVGPDVDENQLSLILNEVADQMKDNYPYFDPKYAGQMLKPPHAISRLAYMLAIYINPNNHALDGGRASSRMEKEVVADIAKMFGWSEHLGHLTGGGTMANMEALWVARKIHPDKYVVASEMAHYTHERISEVVGLPFKKVACDLLGRMDVLSLEEILKNNPVGTVVVTLGTTGTGSVDPLTEILALQSTYGFRIHIDSAYGGYFKLVKNLSPDTKEQYANIHKADSIVIDPHKHGLQPYGCGCILFKDPEVGRHYKHDSPYTYFSSAEMHLGEISLECSRAGAAAVGLWATMKMFPLSISGQFANGISACRNAAIKLHELIINSPDFIPLFEPELDIVVWAKNESSLSEISKKSQLIFKKTAQKGLHLALIKYPASVLPNSWNEIVKDADTVTCLRSCLMKHEHIDFVEELWQTIEEASH